MGNQVPGKVKIKNMDYGVPKYLAIKRDILEKINQEIYKPDETIPSERELIEQYGVSRITVRKAVDELVSECHLYKVQGKGTYVKGNSRITNLSVIMSCSSEIRQQGFTPKKEILSIDTIKCSKKLAHELEINEGANILQIKSIYYADGEPVIYCESRLVKEYFPGIDQLNLNDLSLYGAIQRAYNLNFVDATRYIEAVAAHEKIAEYLDIPEGSPTLRFHGTTRGLINNRLVVFEKFNSNYRTEKIKFRIDQKMVR